MGEDEDDDEQRPSYGGGYSDKGWGGDFGKKKVGGEEGEGDDFLAVSLTFFLVDERRDAFAFYSCSKLTCYSLILAFHRSLETSLPSTPRRLLLQLRPLRRRRRTTSGTTGSFRLVSLSFFG